MEVKFIIPYPPSINALYKAGGGKFWMDKKGKDYKFSVYTHVKKLMAFYKWEPFNINENICVELNQYPVTSHRRDVDAGIKIMLDSLQISGIFENDIQVKKLIVTMNPKISKEKGAYVDVKISNFQQSTFSG